MDAQTYKPENEGDTLRTAIAFMQIQHQSEVRQLEWKHLFDLMDHQWKMEMRLGSAEFRSFMKNVTIVTLLGVQVIFGIFHIAVSSL